MSAITRYGGGFLVVAMGLMAFISATLPSDPAPAERPAAAPPPPTPATVPQIWQAYSDNELAAESVWKGRRVALRATVASVARGPLGGTAVLLRSPGALEARASGLDERDAASLRPGQRVVLYCDVRGVTWSSLMLSRCSL